MHIELPAGRVVMVGFGKLLLNQMEQFLPANSVVVVEDPDIIVKREVHAAAAELDCVDSVVAAPYHQDLALVAAVEEHLAGGPVALVIAGLEYGVHGAAVLAERFGRPGAGTAASAALTDKLRLRAAAQAAGLRNPEWTEVHGPEDVAKFAAGGPVVLKPANRHASLGVQLLEPGDDLAAAWELTVGARDDLMLPDRELDWRYLAERRLYGHEYSVEALVRDGRVEFLNVTDKLTAGGRYPVELGHVVPAAIPAEVQERFAAETARFVAAIGYGTGILHAEWMLGEDGPVLIECAGRVPGDSITFLLDAAYGGNVIRTLVELLAGGSPRLPGPAPLAAAIRFLSAPAGTVVEVTGLDEVERTAGVLRAGVTVGPGDRVAELRSSWDRVGEVLVVAAGPEAALAAAEEAAATLRIHTDGTDAKDGQR
ncbi:ATP-grasp domain-containing protein [Streptomyces sp. NPDC097619]|uniref:ATP-grasp domain-containing protein n=1 Tax=Streptomyces sp. NPDC097619 TaxID=3157228 RepID=UPI00331CAA8F